MCSVNTNATLYLIKRYVKSYSKKHLIIWMEEKDNQTAWSINAMLDRKILYIIMWNVGLTKNLLHFLWTHPDGMEIILDHSRWGSRYGGEGGNRVDAVLTVRTVSVGVSHTSWRWDGQSLWEEGSDVWWRNCTTLSLYCHLMYSPLLLPLVVVRKEANPHQYLSRSLQNLYSSRVLYVLEIHLIHRQNLVSLLQSCSVGIWVWDHLGNEDAKLWSLAPSDVEAQLCSGRFL